jgi:hypothetical protein
MLTHLGDASKEGNNVHGRWRHRNQPDGQDFYMRHHTSTSPPTRHGENTVHVDTPCRRRNSSTLQPQCHGRPLLARLRGNGLTSTQTPTPPWPPTAQDRGSSGTTLCGYGFGLQRCSRLGPERRAKRYLLDGNMPTIA